MRHTALWQKVIVPFGGWLGSWILLLLTLAAESKEEKGKRV